MGIDYDSYLVVGYKIELPEYCDDLDSYLDLICKEVDGDWIRTGNSYTGIHEYFIVPKIDIEYLYNLQQTINDLPRLDRALNHVGIPHGNVVVGAKSLVW